ncbi:unnamed protein product [Protopolystoma xenopodis]|uniref:Uncharacterized protein n=1 Tax=Protopolystoma xenopodis TaxID=117903 RepID=A0A3S5FG84_9PLAT|nr:unnamed protein product [Protopolystoma xenopodis]
MSGVGDSTPLQSCLQSVIEHIVDQIVTIADGIIKKGSRVED